ncbi:MAG: hypothetical protein JRN09_00240 [Nitrososphaerota archaeon]|nr:hypothetical protein [Nitrososphaerota archaeon]
MPDDVLVKVSKVSEKGLVQIPLGIREKLDLQPGTKMVVMVVDGIVVLRKAEFLFEKRKEPSGLIGRLRSVFSRLPIKDIEE